MTQFDFIAGPLLIVSTLIGFSRGASKELTGMIALLGAALTAVFALRFTAPIGRRLIDPDWAGVGVALFFVALVAYIALRMLGAAVTRRAQDTQALGVLDRVGGGGLGFLRAVLLLGAFNLLFHVATLPETEPRWVTAGVTYPISESAGRLLKSFAPEGLAVVKAAAPAVGKAMKDGVADPASTPASPGETGYDGRERGVLDDLVEKTR